MTGLGELKYGSGDIGGEEETFHERIGFVQLCSLTAVILLSNMDRGDLAGKELEMYNFAF